VALADARLDGQAHGLGLDDGPADIGGSRVTSSRSARQRAVRSPEATAYRGGSLEGSLLAPEVGVARWPAVAAVGQGAPDRGPFPYEHDGQGADDGHGGQHGHHGPEDGL
jgi:hypothetical protein